MSESGWLCNEELEEMIERWGRGNFKPEDTVRLVQYHRSLRAEIQNVRVQAAADRSFQNENRRLRAEVEQAQTLIRRQASAIADQCARIDDVAAERDALRAENAKCCQYCEGDCWRDALHKA